jgi:hypothetical protein
LGSADEIAAYPKQGTWMGIIVVLQYQIYLKVRTKFGKVGVIGISTAKF